MSANFGAATSAYNNISQLTQDMTRNAAKPKVPAEENFADMLAQSVQNVVDTGNRSDQLQMDMINGQADIVDVVTAVSETELAIESMVSVRDRVISAYEEILRMPI